MNRNTALALGVSLVFVALCAIVVAMLPGPLGPKDYLVAGAVSTILCLLLLLYLLTRPQHKPTLPKIPPAGSNED